MINCERCEKKVVITGRNQKYYKDCKKENKKEYMEEYNQKTEVKENKKKYQKEYNQRPDVKKKQKKYSKEHSQTPKDKKRAKENRLKKYGLTLKEYNSMVKKQKNKCAICAKEETERTNGGEKVKSLSVDHNHKTGKVRELLCAKCNKGIGFFDDDISKLKTIIKYLRNHKTK